MGGDRIRRVIILELQEEDGEVFEDFLSFLQDHPEIENCKQNKDSIISLPGLEIYPQQRRVFRNQQEIPLTKTEYEILIYLFQNSNQLNVRRIRKAGEGEYIESDYLPVSKRDIGKMYEELLAFIKSVKNPYLNRLLSSFFVDDAAFAKAFQFHSAAKTVHHGFVGGLLEHTLSVTKLCDYYAGYYKELNRDLLITAAIFHDIGKTKELSRFPENDYTDDGQLLGHIIIGTEMISDRMKEIEGFPVSIAVELKHCILAHHGELEYGSPKKPALLEALALNFADNTDAHMETMIEILAGAGENQGWLGYKDGDHDRGIKCWWRNQGMVGI